MTLEELYFSGITEDPNELYHHGILGMKWGIRRYQPYPKGYKGDGKEVGEAKKTRKITRADKKKVKELNWIGRSHSAVNLDLQRTNNPARKAYYEALSKQYEEYSKKLVEDLKDVPLKEVKYNYKIQSLEGGMYRFSGGTKLKIDKKRK